MVIFVILRGLAAADWIGAPGQPALLALAAFTVAGVLVLGAVRIHAAGREHRVAPARVRTTLRERTLRTAFLPQRDPDAAGRPRPRAPGAESAAV
ncbi:DUF6412 domain-containing protein [Spirillospora sp. CA-142024]|uniref:DUF6412 domain-containing protein n=1 Tax=Spirillospora sp. CA-142024 TaxID=3240036 RepID=UPI003D900643